jgi:hypothetical protein
MPTSKKTAEVYDDIMTMPLAELRRRVTEALLLFAKLDELLPGLIELTADAKLHSSGHYRTNEAEALTGLLDVADKKPATFESLAAKDGGHDPTRFEPEVLRDRLERVIILGPLVKAALEFASPASDTRLHLSNLTRPVLLAMYQIIKPQAEHDVTIASMCKAALDFYAAVGKLAAATRKANKNK